MSNGYSVTAIPVLQQYLLGECYYNTRMPYLDKNKQRTAVREALRRLRAERKTKGLCTQCGQATPEKTKKIEQVKAVSIPKAKDVAVVTGSLAVCSICRRLVPREEVDLYGHCKNH